MQKLNKKAQANMVGRLLPIIIVLGTAIVTAALMAAVIGNLGSIQTVDNTVTNESITVSGTLAQTGTGGISNGSIDVRNSTDVLVQTDFDFDLANLLTGITPGGSTVYNVSYTFNDNTFAGNVTTQGARGASNFAGQFPAIGLIVIAIVLVGLLVGMFRIR